MATTLEELEKRRELARLGGGEKRIANRPVILKPFRSNDLLAFVRQALDQKER